MPSKAALPSPVLRSELNKIANTEQPTPRITARKAIMAINDMLRDAARNDHAIGERGFHETFPTRGDTLSEALAKKVEKHFESTLGYHVEAVDQDHLADGSSGWALEVSWWPDN